MNEKKRVPIKYQVISWLLALLALAVLLRDWL